MALLLALTVAFLAPANVARAQQASQPAPDPVQILQAARSSYSLQNYQLDGHLENDAGKTPFNLVMQSGTVQFAFADPPQVVRLDITPDGSALREEINGKGGPVKAERYREPVRGTDITYEDLSMRFLHWPRPAYWGTEKIRGRDCWKITVLNPDKNGPYHYVALWVDTASGALLQMLGMSEDQKVIRKFHVVSGQKVDGVWVLKEMRVESYDPATGKRLGRTYLVLDSPRKM